MNTSTPALVANPNALSGAFLNEVDMRLRAAIGVLEVLEDRGLVEGESIWAAIYLLRDSLSLIEGFPNATDEGRA